MVREIVIRADLRGRVFLFLRCDDPAESRLRRTDMTVDYDLGRIAGTVVGVYGRAMLDGARLCFSTGFGEVRP